MAGASVFLDTPPVRCVVPDGVFDAFGWCASDKLAWRSSCAIADDVECAITDTNPAGMAFVFNDRPPSPCDSLPRELARLHVQGLGLDEEVALAPYAIDDATDELYAQRVRPRELLWLAASSVGALFWGLHDWSHFHNHGPFEERAWTELQCDVSALAWMWINRSAIGMSDARWERARCEVEKVARARFDGEKKPFDASLFDAAFIRALVA
jgi:hypothetical protein